MGRPIVTPDRPAFKVERRAVVPDNTRTAFNQKGGGVLLASRERAGFPQEKMIYRKRTFIFLQTGLSSTRSADKMSR